MSLQYIRDNYRVPAKRGGRIEYTDKTALFIRGFTYSPKRGTIVGAVAAGKVNTIIIPQDFKGMINVGGEK